MNAFKWIARTIFDTMRIVDLAHFVFRETLKCKLRFKFVETNFVITADWMNFESKWLNEF